MRFTILTLAVSLALVGAASGETRALSGFTGVNASDRIPVEITIGDGYRVEVTGADAARVRTEVDDGALRIRQRNRPWFGGPPRIDARVVVTMPSLDSIAASKGAEVNATGIDSGSLDLSASMGGAIDAAGRCRALTVAASMGGAVDADAVQCERADISASMGGSADVYASAAISAAASMGGAVTVEGNPTSRDVSTSMGGSVSLR